MQAPKKFEPIVVVALGALCLTLTMSRSARAHFTLVQPPPADSATDGGKGAAPCGPTAASNVVTKVQGGHPLTLSVSETVLHPGHYRVALSMISRTELPGDPPVTTIATPQGLQSVSTTIQNPPKFPVLADGVFPHTTGKTPIPFETTIMLPNITCAKCTLQVIEFMAQHGTPYFYHHCADLQITADPNLPKPDGGLADGGGTDGGSGDASTERPAGAGGNSGASGGGGAGNTGTGGGSSGSGGFPEGTGGRTGASGGAQASGGATTSTGGSNSGSGGVTTASTGGATSASGGINGGTGGTTSGTGGAPSSGTGGAAGCSCALAQSTGSTGLAALGCLALVALSVTIRRRRPGARRKTRGPAGAQGM